MRLAVFIFSFYLVFGQIYYAHSGLPVLGGAVAVARGVGTLIKGGKVLKGSMWGAGAVYAYCTATPANKKRCKELGGEAVDLILGDDDDDDENATCRYRFAINTNDTPKSASETYAEILNNLSEKYPSFEYKNHPKHNEQINMFIREHKQFVKERPSSVNRDDVWHVARLDNTYYFSRYKYSDDMTYHESPHSIVMFANCSGNKDNDAYDDDDEQRRKKEQELWDKLKDKLSDDDITNIVNNYGDDIDIDKYCASGATCYFLDTDFEKEINNNDYDIDKVTNDNCNTRNGKIYSCPNAKKKKDRDDDDDDTNSDDDKQKDDDGQTNNNDDKDKDGIKIPNIPNFALPKFCTWAKHVCDFTEWVKEPPKIDDKDDYKPEITDLSGKFNKIDNSYYNASGSCPAPVPVNLTYGTVYISYQSYCDFAVKISPLVIALAYILGAYIVVRGK